MGTEAASATRHWVGTVTVVVSRLSSTHLPCRDLWCWLLHAGILRTEVGTNLLIFYLVCKSLGLLNRNLI